MELLLAGTRPYQIGKELGLTHRTIKAHLHIMYTAARVTGHPLISLIRGEMEHRRPDLIAFANGDRASEVGRASASEHAALKMAEEDDNESVMVPLRITRGEMESLKIAASYAGQKLSEFIKGKCV